MSAGSPSFFSYNLKNMRQIPSGIFSAAAGGGLTPIVSAFIPASSWAINRNLLIRAIYKLEFKAPVPVLPYAITESVTLTGAGTFGLPTPPPFTPVVSVYTTQIQRNFVRIDPNIFVLDMGDCYQHTWANQDDAVQHVLTVPPVGPPFAYASPIQIDLNVLLPASPGPVTLTALWAEAFLEQGTNLGKIP